MKNLVLVRGLPSSGKSTFAKMLNVDFKIEADTYHYVDGVYDWKPENVKASHKWCQQETELAMKNGLDIAVSNTFTTEWEMQCYFDMAEQYGYRVTTIIIEKRHDNSNDHNVPDDTISKMKNRFEISL